MIIGAQLWKAIRERGLLSPATLAWGETLTFKTLLAPRPRCLPKSELRDHMLLLCVMFKNISRGE